MKKQYFAIPALTISALVVMGTLEAGTKNQTRGDDEPLRGPDVVGWFVGGSGNGLDMNLYGQENGVLGFAFGTTSCNFGDAEAEWYGGTNRVPVIAQTAYRLKDGIFEQIGTAWLKHSFCAVSEPGCGDCQSTPCSTLGIGCADTYWAGLNADATAPRSAINAHTGYYDYPFTISPTGDSGMRGKLHLKEEDIDPALNEGAVYFLECQYVSPDDAEWNNQDNNCSYKWIKFSPSLNPIGLSTTQVEDSAMHGWKFFDEDVDLRPLRVPDEGLLEVGVRVNDLGDGTWRYVYAIHNMNSDRSIQSFEVPVGDCVTVSDIGFNDINHGSGEIIDGTDWDVSHSEGTVKWSTVSYDTNEWANAIRWGSTYTFWFTADQGPDEGELNLGIFKPGDVNELMHLADVPDCPSDCIGDVNGDNYVDVSDILEVIAYWGSDNEDADVNSDGTVDVIDLLEVIGNWGCS